MRTKPRAIWGCGGRSRGGEQLTYFKTSEPNEDECLSLDLAKLQRTPRDRRLRVFVRTLACVRVCMCVCARASFSRVLSLFLTPFFSPLLSPFFSFSFSFSLFLSLSFLSLGVLMSLCLCVSMSLSLCFFVFVYLSIFASLCLYVFVSLCLCFSLCLCLTVSLYFGIFASLCLDWKLTPDRDTIVSSTHSEHISLNSMHELDETSGSTPKTVISTLFDLLKSREFGIKKDNLTPEFPRKKEFQKNVEYATKSNSRTFQYVTISRIRNFEFSKKTWRQKSQGTKIKKTEK